MRWRRWRWYFLIGATLMLLLVLFAHPFFAITRSSGGRVLVAEGWIHRDGLLEAMRTFRAGGYERLYLTGTLRPFAYHLHGGEGFTIISDRPITGEIHFEVTGLPGAKWALMGDGDTLLTGVVTKKLVRHRMMTTTAVQEIRFLETSLEGPPGVPVVYVGSMTAMDANLHAWVDTMILHHADGGTKPGWPTHAEFAHAILLQEGLPDSLMRLVPDRATHARTQASAQSFVAIARADGIDRFDVATLAVHARRTWRAYVAAADTEEGVGIIALDDPWCRRWTWWLGPYGWFQVLKELAALPVTLTT